MVVEDPVTDMEGPGQRFGLRRRTAQRKEAGVECQHVVSQQFARVPFRNDQPSPQRRPSSRRAAGSESEAGADRNRIPGCQLHAAHILIDRQLRKRVDRGFIGERDDHPRAEIH